MAVIGDLRNDKLEPRLSNRDLGSDTELTVTVGRERLTGYKTWHRYVRNVSEGFNPSGNFIVINGKLYELMFDEVWEPLLSDDATVTILWSYGSLSGTVATDIPTNGARNVKVPWTIPTTLAAENMVFSEFAVQFTVQVADGSYTPTWGPETVVASTRPRVPLDLVPTFVQWGFSEGNPEIAEGAPFVPSSVLRASPVFEGTLGAAMSTVTTWFNLIVDALPNPITGSVIRGGTVIPPEGLPMAAPGVFNVGAKGIDARGRWVEATTTVTVAEYTRPAMSLSAQRARVDGVPDPAGNRISVTLATQVHFLGGLNSHQIRVYTRLFGTATWDEQNVIDPPSTGYTGTFLVDGEYAALQAWEVLVEVQDAITVLSDSRVIPSKGQIINADRGHLALGRSIDPDGLPVQIQGPARVYGEVQADNLPLRRLVGVKPAGVTELTVPLAGFTDPKPRLTVEYNSTTAADAWVRSLSATQMVIRVSNANAIVHYTVEEYPWVAPAPLAEVSEPVLYSPVMSARTIIFVGKYVPSTAQQFAYDDLRVTNGVISGSSTSVRQLDGGVFVAWRNAGASVESVGRYSGGTAQPWEGAFRAELYSGDLPTSFMREVIQRMAIDLGVAVTLGPQFD